MRHPLIGRRQHTSRCHLADTQVSLYAEPPTAPCDLRSDSSPMSAGTLRPLLDRGRAGLHAVPHPQNSIRPSSASTLPAAIVLIFPSG